MCGILALFSAQGTVSESALQSGLDNLKHRGPDGQKLWVSPDHRVGLGHRRLSIIDLISGDQPISNRQENLHIIANGEFYDYEKIQRDLKSWGYELKTNCDSEIALHLYDQFGTECLHYLRGEFAFIIWDARNEILFAARDRFGIKPLYFSNYNNTLYLASEVKALFGAGVPAAWDEESFWQDSWRVLPQDRTLFANVYQVPPGHYLISSNAGVRLYKYWDFNYPVIDNYPSPKKPEDYILQLREVLDEAIKLRLRADVPVGCYLSGGLDSSTVLGISANHLSEPMQAFTIAFDHDAYNEEAIAQETAISKNAQLQVIPVSQVDVAEHFFDTIWHCEMLSGNSNAVAKYLLSLAARDAGYKVVLTGEGSDEIFGGYVHFRQDILRQNQGNQDDETVKQQLAELKAKNQVSLNFLFAGEEHIPALDTIQNLLNFVPAWMQGASQTYQNVKRFYNSEYVSQFQKRDVYRLFFNQIDVKNQLNSREHVNQSLYLWSKTTLVNYLFRLLGDGVEMAHSIEGRLPFLDHKVVELVCNMPVDLKINGLTEKYVLREAAKPFITDTVYNRQKHPFVAPPSTFNPHQPLQQLIQDTLRSNLMSRVPFYNQAAVIKLLDELPTMDNHQRAGVDMVLISILSACALQERFELN